MPSPFPGMNPCLEQEDAWHDFHERFVPLVASTLGSQLRPRYIVMIAPQSASAPVTGLLEAPARVRPPAVDHERLSYVEILDRRNRELVTVVELLSLTGRSHSENSIAPARITASAARDPGDRAAHPTAPERAVQFH